MDTCTCERPQPETIETGVQEGGEIKTAQLGKWCRVCDKEYISQENDRDVYMGEDDN